MSKKPLLRIKNLKTYFYTDNGVVKAVDDIDLDIYSGEFLGLVGESGCGKSITSMSIMNLIEEPGRILDGNIFFHSTDLLKLNGKSMSEIRGNKISMIFQQPLTSLDPVFTIGEQISEVFKIHKKTNKRELREKVINLLQLVGIADPENKIDSYAFELSGGQAQRVMIAMALALQPELLIADEPTTALDVTIQAQILDLLRGLREKINTSVILITHDLGVIAETCDRVAVMYAGKIIEQADVVSLFEHPLHPYTQGLLASVPVLGNVKDELDAIPGNVPDLIDLPQGCRFAPRCKKREDNNLQICNEVEPNILPVSSSEHIVRCWLYQKFEEDHLSIKSRNK